MIINQDAIFIADSHYSYKNTNLLFLLKELLKNPPSQVFLLGDIFDFLTYGEYFIDTNKVIIDMINQLSKKSKIFYFEGNHDFNLKTIFSNITIFSYKEQPVLFKYNNKNVYISHGDIFSKLLYTIYTNIIRNKFVLDFILFVDKKFNFFISKALYIHLFKKDICTKIDNFEEIVKDRIKKYKNKYSVDIIIEGHFHQGKEYIFGGIRYINVSALACGKKYFKLKEI